MISGIKKFIGEVQAEMKKVSWPSSEQLIESTYVVLAVSAIITTIVFLMDTGVTQLLGVIF